MKSHQRQLKESLTIMPVIKSSDDLRNNYNEISSLCHDSSEPVFITRNGEVDLAVMSIESYESLIDRFELYKLLNEGFNDVVSGKTKPFSEAMSEIREIRR